MAFDPTNADLPAPRGIFGLASPGKVLAFAVPTALFAILLAAVAARAVLTGSLAAAGRRLRRSAPAITRTLHALEARAGARLVERTTRRLLPTERGRRLADEARGILAAYAGAVRADDAAIADVLRVTAPLVFGRRHVMPLLLRFQDRQPGLRVEAVLNDRDLDLADEEIDAAIRIGEVGEAGFVTRRVGAVRRVLVASPAYLARSGRLRRRPSLAGTMPCSSAAGRLRRSGGCGPGHGRWRCG